MTLVLKNIPQSIAIFDLETTGKPVKTSRIVSIYADFYQNTERISSMDWLINPNIAIENSHIHNITDEMVEDAPCLKKQGKELIRRMRKADILCGYNILKYDVPLLQYDLIRNGYRLNLTKFRYLDVMEIVKKEIANEIYYTQGMNDSTIRPSLSLEKVFEFCKNLVGSSYNVKTFHEASSDVSATAFILNVLVDFYNIDVTNYIKDYKYLKNYRLQTEDLDYKINHGNMYYGRTLRSLMKDTDPKVKSWLIKQHENVHVNFSLSEDLVKMI